MVPLQREKLMTSVIQFSEELIADINY